MLAEGCGYNAPVLRSLSRGLILLVSLSGAALCQTAGQLLAPASSVTETLAGTAEASFLIAVPANQTLEFQVVDRVGVAGLFTAESADGKALAFLDTFRRRKQLLSEGERAVRDDNFEAAITAYKNSLPLWVKLSGRSRQAYALLQIGDSERTLGNMKAGLAHTLQALDLWTAAGEASCRGEALAQMASIEANLGDKQNAAEHAAEALKISRRGGDAGDMANDLLLEGELLLARGETERARADYTEASKIAREAHRPYTEQDVLMFLAVLEHNQGHWKESIEASSRSLEIAREQGDDSTAGTNLAALAANYLSLGELRKAIGYAEQAAAIFRKFPNPDCYGNVLYTMAACYAGLDEYPKAIDLYSEALPIYRKMNVPVGQAYILMGWGECIALSATMNGPIRLFGRLRRNGGTQGTSRTRSSPSMRRGIWRRGTGISPRRSNFTGKRWPSLATPASNASRRPRSIQIQHPRGRVTQGSEERRTVYSGQQRYGFFCDDNGCSGRPPCPCN